MALCVPYKLAKRLTVNPFHQFGGPFPVYL